MTSNLTESAIKAAQPGDVLKDHVVDGLQVRCFAQSKAFYLYYRSQAGVQRRPKLGTVGQLTLTTAREAARAMLARVAQGLDPSAERVEARAELTLDEVFVEFKAKHLAKMKAGRQYEQRYLRVMKPRWGGRKLSAISHREVEQLKEAIGEPKPIGQGKPIAANRMLIELSSLYTFARRRLKIDIASPTRDIPHYPENKRRRYMRGEEPARIAEILDREAHGRNMRNALFVYLLILSGARKSEIGGARWEWLHGNVLHLPDSKTGRKEVYLPPPAMDILARLPRDHGTLCGVKKPDDFWRRIRVEAGCPDLRLHDLRHSFASAALSAGLSLSQIGELLGHKSTQTTKRYAHLVEEVASAAASVTADKLMLAMKKAPADPRHSDEARADG